MAGAINDKTSGELNQLSHEIALALLKIKCEIPVLEFGDSGVAGYDFDKSEKLLIIALGEHSNLPIKDFLRLKHLEHTLNVII